MNKNYLFILIAVAVIILVVVLYSSMITTLSLDQIIKNKDCTALSKWEEEHIFDDNLNISSEQLSSAMKLAVECVGKAFKNMDGSPDSSSKYITTEERLDKIFETEDCDAMKNLREEKDLMTLSITKYSSTDIRDFTSYCENNINSQK